MLLAHWHPLKQLPPCKKQDGSRLVHKLEKRHYGTHQEDSEFSALPRLNVIAVDPGHVNLISAVRLHNTEDALMKCDMPAEKTEEETGNQRRRKDV